jgi:hypothetical protein
MSIKTLRSYIRELIQESTFIEEKEKQTKYKNREVDKDFTELQLDQLAQNIIMSHGNMADHEGQDGWEKIVDRRIESEKTYGRSLNKDKLMKSIEKRLKDYGLKAKASDLKTRYKDGYGGAN